MLELIIGAKGKGKTKKMVEKANNESKLTNGSIVYIDRTNKHMYELSNTIRLINLREYDVNTKDSFNGFIQGLISYNHDLTHIYLDNFMLLSCVDSAGLPQILDEINAFSNKYNITFVLSTAVELDEIPDKFKDNISCVL